MKFLQHPQTKQKAVKDTLVRQGEAMTDVGRIVKAYSERMSCDVVLLDGVTLRNTPILTKGSTEDGKISGEISLPLVNDYVVLLFVNGRPVIIGTILPYLNENFFTQELPGIEGKNKQHTQKLLEEGKPKTWKRVYPSGTTLEVADDGSLYLEVPDLGSLVFNVSEHTVGIKDGSDNSVVLSEHGIVVTDAVNNNRISLTSSGIEIADKNGNNITMQPGKVVINNNLEVLL